MNARPALLALVLAAAACSSPGGPRPGAPAAAGEIEVTSEVENLAVTPREGDLATLTFRVSNRTSNPVILRDLSQPVDLMLSGSTGAVATWQYAQSGLLTYLPDLDEWVYDKSKRADVPRPVFNSGLLVPGESLSIRTRLRLLSMPMDFQFSYFELTKDDLRRKVYFERRQEKEKTVRYRLLVGRDLDEALTPSQRTEVGGQRFVIFPHAEPVANTPLLKTYRFQSPLKPRLFGKEQAARQAGVEGPRKGSYTYSTLFDGWILAKGSGHVLVTPSGAAELPDLRNVERIFYLIDTAGPSKIEIELRAHSAASALSELRYQVVKQEKDVPITKEVKEKRTFYYLFLASDQLPRLFADLRRLKLVVDVEYGDGGGRLQILNK